MSAPDEAEVYTLTEEQLLDVFATGYGSGMVTALTFGAGWPLGRAIEQVNAQVSAFADDRAATEEVLEALRKVLEGDTSDGFRLIRTEPRP